MPPTKVIYVYKVWQSKYDEMLSLGVNFKEDNDNIVHDIKSNVTGEPTLIIFDDLIGSSSLKEIANLFTVDARHMNMSLVFLTQRMFVNPSGSGGGHIVPANFWKAHRAKISIHNILFFGVTFSFYMWTT